MATLRVRKGTHPGTLYPVLRTGQPTVIGRDASCDIVLDDAKASRRNTSIALVLGVWVVQDLGSSNGTFVNARRIRKARLEDAGNIQVGGTLLTFEAGGLAAFPDLDAGGARPTETLREASGVFVFHGIQEAMEREVRIDWLCPARRLEPPALDRIRRALEDARAIVAPGIFPLVRTEADPDGGGIFVLLKGSSRPSVQDRLPEILALPLPSRVRIFRQIVELVLERATWESLRSPVGLPHLIIEGGFAAGQEGVAIAVPPVELSALVAEASGDLLQLPEHAACLPPEYQGDPAANAPPLAAAMYNAGAMGYHILTGRPPAGEGSIAEILENHEKLDPAPPSLLNPDIPERISDLLGRMLAKEPGRRPRERQEVTDLLTSFVDLVDRPGAIAAAFIPGASIPGAPAPGISATGASGPGASTAAPAIPAAAAGRPSAPSPAPARPRPEAAPRQPTTARRERGRVRPRSIFDSVLYAPLWAAVWVGLFLAARHVSRIVFEALEGK